MTGELSKWPWPLRSVLFLVSAMAVLWLAVCFCRVDWVNPFGPTWSAYDRGCWLLVCAPVSVFGIPLYWTKP